MSGKERIDALDDRKRAGGEPLSSSDKGETNPGGCLGEQSIGQKVKSMREEQSFAEKAKEEGYYKENGKWYDKDGVCCRWLELDEKYPHVAEKVDKYFGKYESEFLRHNVGNAVKNTKERFLDTVEHWSLDILNQPATTYIPFSCKIKLSNHCDMILI